MMCTARTVLVLLCGAAYAACGSDGEAGGRSLTLEEVATWAPPDGLPVGGVGSVVGERVVVWAAAEPWAFVLRVPSLEMTARVRLPPGLVPVAARAMSDFRVEVWGADGRAVLVPVGDDGASSPEGGRDGALLVSADYGARGWITAWQRPEGGPIQVRTDSPGASVGMDAYGWVLAHGDGFTFARIRRPFAGALVDGEGNVALSMRPPPALLAEISGDDTLVGEDPWIAMPLVPLDHGLIQVLANTRTHDRVVLRYDSAGVVAAHQRIESPLGLLRHLPDGAQILGVRGVGAGEVVLYEWRWGGPMPGPQEVRRRGVTQEREEQ